jgi:transposase
MPLRVLVTAGSVADCTQGQALTENLSTQCLVADKGYDANQIVDRAKAAGTTVLISPGRHSRQQREYDQHLYSLRHLVENAFMNLKQWRAIATRYAKRAASYLAAVQIRCALLWASIS